MDMNQIAAKRAARIRDLAEAEAAEAEALRAAATFGKLVASIKAELAALNHVTRVT
jgi:hypothetical protein